MLKEFLTGTKLGCATVVKDVLTVYPVIGSNGASEPDCVTFGEAIQTGAAAVREVEDGATVPDVDVTVTGERPLLVVEGEVLEDGKQRRTVNISLILPKGKHGMPVSCIEATVGVGENHLLEGDVDGFVLVAEGTIKHLFAYPM